MAERGDDRVEARDQARRREQVRQEVDAAPERRDAPPLPAGDDPDAGGIAHPGSSATTVVPPCTPSPTWTRGRAAAGTERCPPAPDMNTPHPAPRPTRPPPP